MLIVYTKSEQFSHANCYPYVCPQTGALTVIKENNAAGDIVAAYAAGHWERVLME